MLINNNFAGHNIKDLSKWNYFKSLDLPLQKSFINELKQEYDANTSSLAEMFNVNYTVVDAYFKRNLIVPFRGKSRDNIKNKKWKDFLKSLTNEKCKNRIETLRDQAISGELTFKGISEEVLPNIAMLCKNKKITITVKW